MKKEKFKEERRLSLAAGKKTTFLYFFLLLFIFNCKEKNNPAMGPEFPNPTPSSPNVPFFFQRYFQEPIDNPATIEGIALGKALFFDKSLSKDNTISCGSCHRPEKAFSDGIPLAIGIQNRIGKRNTPGLFNIGIQKKFFWDGRDTSLEQQSLHPIQDENEMGMNLNDLIVKLKNNPVYPPLFGKAFGNTEVTVDKISKSIAQFERSLFTQNSKYDRYLKGQYNPDPDETKGMQLFFLHPEAGILRGGNCGDCHFPGTLFGKQDGFEGFHNTGLTKANSFDIGLQRITNNSADFGKFKTPGLRNIALTAPYMHDGRFETLEEVLDHYNSDTLFDQPNIDLLITAGKNERFKRGLNINSEEKRLIIKFLHMLTDSSALFAP